MVRSQEIQGLVLREQSALDRFVACMVEDRGLSQEDAKILRDFWTIRKVLKIDRVVGQWSVVHGAFLNDEAISRSIKCAKCKICNGKGKVKRQDCSCMD